MNKFAKILLLIFALVALVGVFTFAVSAETDSGTTSNVAIEEIGANGQVIRSTNDNFFNWGTTGGGMDFKTVQNGSTIKCYQDVYIREGNVYFNHGINVTIDLNGHTLYLCDKNGTGRTFDFGYGESTPTTYIVKNGTITDNNQAASRIQARAYMTLVFEDITFDFTNGGYIYDRCSEKIVFDGCTVKSQVKQLVTRSNDAAKEVNGTYAFNDFTLDATSRDDLILVNLVKSTKAVDVVYSGNSVFNEVNSNNITVNSTTFTGAVSLKIAEGVGFGRNIDNFGNSVVVYYYSSITLSDYAPVYGNPVTNAILAFDSAEQSFYELAALENTASVSDGNSTVYYVAGISVAEGTTSELYYNAEDGNLYRDISGIFEGDTPVTVLEAGKSYMAKSQAVKDTTVKIAEISSSGAITQSLTNNILTTAFMNALVDGSTVKLYDNVYLEANLTIANSIDVTIDLNKNTLYMCNSAKTALYRIDFGKWASSYPTGDIHTVKNGTIECAKDGGAILQVRPNKTVIFDGVTFNILKTEYIYDMGSDRIVFNNCTLNQPESGSYFLNRSGNNTSGSVVNYIFNDFTLNSDKTNAICVYLAGTNDVKVVYTGNTTLNKASVELYKLASSYTGTATLDIAEGVKFGRNTSYCDSNVTVKYYKSIELGNDYTLSYGNELKKVYLDESGALTALQLKSNLTLFTDFNLNFFVPEAAKVSSVTVGSSAVATTTVLIDGERYTKFTVTGIAANLAAGTVEFTINYVGVGETEASASGSYSIISYAATLLTSDFSQESKQLVKSALEYVASAYALSGAVPSDLTGLISDYADYTVTTQTATANGSDLSSANFAIHSAQYNLASELKLILNIKSGYTGTITVNNTAYAVTDGKLADGAASIVIAMRAYELYENDITIVVVKPEDSSSVTVNYDLATYVATTVKNDGSADAIDALLQSLYTYCYYANEYRLSDNGNLK